MRFNVSGNTLKQRLQGVGKVVNPKNALSILDNFLLTVKGETLTILGSDQENVVVSTVEITDVEGEGSIAVPARRLLDMMKELPDVNLKFEIDPETQRIELDYWSGHFSFMGFPGAEFPMQKEREADSRRVLIPADVLRDCIEHALYAVSTDTIRPVMTGVCFDFREDKMLLASSDTHKLVKCETTMVQPGFESRFVMPAKACGLLKALLDKVEGDVVLTMDSKGATFEFDNSSVSCVFITGNYPPYEKVFPSNNPYSLEVDRNNLCGVLRRMILTSNKGSHQIRLNIQQEQMEISSEDLDFGMAGKESLPVNYNGNPMALGFNAEYTLEVVNNLKADSVVIYLSDPSRPALIEPAEQPEGCRVTVLLMTMQLLS